MGDRLARFDTLKPGSRLYLRYSIKGDQRSAIDIWRRTISYEDAAGRRVMRIRQRWDRVSPPGYVVEQDSVFETPTFRPLRHERRVTRDGKVEFAAYTFLADRVIGDPAAPQNKRLGFEQATAEPVFNFETDIELFQSLPLRRGYAAEINFYDPGLEPPKHYVFRVVRDEFIETPDGRRVPCWVLSSDYGRPERRPAEFWVAKSTQVLIREAAPMPDGSTLIKTLLSDEPRG